MKQIRYMMEAILLGVFFLIFKLMSAQMASSIGGWIGRTVGPRLRTSRKILSNLNHALPGKTEGEYHTIMQDMWNNLGRVVAEYPHLLTIVKKAEIVGENHLNGIGESFVVIGGHLANWELLAFYFNQNKNLPVTGIYRAPNNPYTEWLLDKCRNPNKKGDYVPKSKTGTRALVNRMRSGGRTMILIDQKYNEGIKADFFGQPAMTSTAFAQLAKKYNCPIVPVWIERTDNKSKLRITIDPPIKVDGRSEEDMVTLAHALLEERILKNPGQWLWLHRRWIT